MDQARDTKTLNKPRIGGGVATFCPVMISKLLCRLAWRGDGPAFATLLSNWGML